MYNFNCQLPSITEETTSYFDYYFRLKGLACTMFKWEGLPESVDERYLEETLYSRGYCGFFYDDNMGYLALAVSISGKNVYGAPNRFMPVTNGSIPETFHVMDEKECVLIRNTYDCIPTMITTMRYAQSLFNIDGARDTNIEAQKTPYIIMTDEKQRRTLENIYAKIKANMRVIFGVKNVLDPKNISVLKTGAPFVAGQLQDMKLTIQNEYITMLGLGTTNEGKRERTITGEIQETEKQTTALSNILLAPREQAAKEINRLFPELNVSVKMRNDLDYAMPKFSSSYAAANYNTNKVEGDKDGDTYD